MTRLTLDASKPYFDRYIFVLRKTVEEAFLMLKNMDTRKDLKPWETGYRLRLPMAQNYYLKKIIRQDGTNQYCLLVEDGQTIPADFDALLACEKGHILDEFQPNFRDFVTSAEII